MKSRSLSPPSRDASSTAVPTVGWPAKGSSFAGVKMRSLARCDLFSGGCTNTVSDRLNSRAIDCIAAVSRPSGSSTTASGLPAKRFSVNTSSVTKRRRMQLSSNRFSREHLRWLDELFLRVDQEDFPRSTVRSSLQHAEHRRRRARQGLGGRAGAQHVRKEQRRD